jgi:2-oxoglutarate ferredoxin oxidoreductase subunit gamma
MHAEVVIAGFGGQGILFLGRVLAEAGMIEGYEVTWFPSYGPEMRGGTANCTVIISEEEIGATVTAHPDICVVMNEPSLRRFANSVRKGGLLLVNSSLVSTSYQSDAVEVLEIPANELAKKTVGNPRVINMVMLGGLLARRELVKFASAEKALQNILRGKKNLLEPNLIALRVGWDFVIKGGEIHVS